jgi:hypothetical protein
MRRFVVVLMLAGCSAPSGGGRDPGAAVVPGRGGDPVPCGADVLAALVGQPLTALPGDEVSGPIRVIRPGDAVTEDFIRTRLNVSLDGNDVIAALSCG